jgi:hypothetical protein
MEQPKVRISARISKELADKCLQRYDNITSAVIAGLELLINGSEDESVRQSEGMGVKSEDNSGRTEIKKLEALLEEKDHRIKDLQSFNESLEKDKERAGQEKEVIQNLYNNYMLQMQTLINQKAIEAPGSKRPWWQFW